jgi:hypothetical protein
MSASDSGTSAFNPVTATRGGLSLGRPVPAITVRQVDMARKRRERKHTGLFDLPDTGHDDDESADATDGVGVFGGPTNDSRLFGGPGHSSGLFDVPDRAPGDMPGLFDRPGRAASSGAGKTREGDGRGTGLFDKPKPRRGSRA